MSESNPFTRKYFGTLLVAYTCNPQNHIFPSRLSFAIVESENRDSWTWFLIQLLEEIFNRKHHVIIISDRQKGLLGTVPLPFQMLIIAIAAGHLAQTHAVKQEINWRVGIYR